MVALQYEKFAKADTGHHDPEWRGQEEFDFDHGEPR
jgi:hypothetical protein